MTEAPGGDGIDTQLEGGSPREQSEIEKRATWSSVMDKMEESRVELGPYFAAYGEKSEEADTRAFVIRAPAKEFSIPYYVAITPDGPFKLLIQPQLADLGDISTINKKLQRDAIETVTTPNTGYSAEETDDDITRTITLDDNKYRFTWSTEYERQVKRDPLKTPPATLSRANGAQSLLAIRFAEKHEGSDTAAINAVIKSAIQATGVPQTGYVKM